MLLTGWDSASGITPPASSSSSVASTSILLFFISICRLWLILLSYVCFVSSKSRSVSEWTCLNLISPGEVLGTFLCLAFVLSYTVIFPSVHGICSWILLDRYFGLAGCHGGRFLVAGLCYIVLCFTVKLYRRLSLFAYCHLKAVEYYFLIFFSSYK